MITDSSVISSILMNNDSYKLLMHTITFFCHLAETIYESKQGVLRHHGEPMELTTLQLASAHQGNQEPVGFVPAHLTSHFFFIITILLIPPNRIPYACV